MNRLLQRRFEAYKPQKVIVGLGTSSQAPGLISTGLTAIRSMRPIGLSYPTRTPSNALRTFTPSLSSRRRPVPSTTSWRPAMTSQPGCGSTLAGVVENAIFGVNLVDGDAPASGIVFTKDVTKIADQQRRYAV